MSKNQILVIGTVYYDFHEKISSTLLEKDISEIILVENSLKEIPEELKNNKNINIISQELIDDYSIRRLSNYGYFLTKDKSPNKRSGGTNKTPKKKKRKKR